MVDRIVNPVYDVPRDPCMVPYEWWDGQCWLVGVWDERTVHGVSALVLAAGGGHVYGGGGRLLVECADCASVVERLIVGFGLRRVSEVEGRGLLAEWGMLPTNPRVS